MKFSFYRNLTWLIGILVAVEIFLKLGIGRGLIFIVADLVIVLILTFLFHRLRSAGVKSGAFNPDSVSNVINTKSESEWQKKHDQWWQTHRQMTMVKPVSPQITTPPRSTSPEVTSSLAKDSQPDASHELDNQINHLNRKMAVIQGGQNQQLSDQKPSKSKWLGQVKQIKRQIAKLKSEYK